jgi:hypothetical protein
MAKKRHVRIVCPHCGNNIALVPPRTPLGFVKPVPCPSCHIPIQPAHIKVQTEPLPEPEPEAEAKNEATGAAETNGQEGESEDEDGNAKS